jgi:uncharacterized RDD family membrane protein YckC
VDRERVLRAAQVRLTAFRAIGRTTGMTQQNETQQHGAAAPGQPEPLAPARPELAGTEQLGTAGQPASAQVPAPAAALPSLYGYEALPEAYLAPPQPGQPRYGTPQSPVGGRPLAGRPGYGQPGYGQPGYGQPGYGQRAARHPANGRPAPARPGFGTAARRDPAVAPPWQRLVAQTIDWIIIMVVSVIVFWSQLSVVWRELQAVTGRYRDLTNPAAQAAINSISRNPANQHALLYWFLGIFGLALAYYWVQDAAWGATIGKRAMGVRVVRAADRSRIGVLAAGIRTVAFLAGPAVFLLFSYPVNVVGGILWAADAGLPLLDSRAQSLHDRLAGTVVVRRRALDERAPRTSAW